MKTKILQISLLLVGMLLGYLLSQYTQKENLAFGLKRQGEYQFINPLLDVIDEEEFPQELKPFKSKVEKIIGQQVEAGNANRVSVYFRDLNNGPWFGINEKDGYLPASLLKVPLMMNYYKEAEKNPGILNDKIVYRRLIDNLDQRYKPSQQAEVGKEYTAEELIELMIKYSDNNSLALLVEHFDALGKSRLGIFKSLDVNFDLKPESEISVKNYSTFFRILFNSSYLSQYYSEKALEILADTEFDSGIRQGVPKEIAVAEKFGERQATEDEVSLHACGIVYYPKHPYLLCMMTSGKNYDRLSSAIKTISETVYGEVKNQTKE
ncbi:MAG: serine hydrolase [Candidatus Saccharibacteria bacterium]